jgi:hypothetical protein
VPAPRSHITQLATNQAVSTQSPRSTPSSLCSPTRDRRCLHAQTGHKQAHQRAHTTNERHKKQDERGKKNDIGALVVSSRYQLSVSEKEEQINEVQLQTTQARVQIELQCDVHRATGLRRVRETGCCVVLLSTSFRFYCCYFH